MKPQRFRALGFALGVLPTGAHNAITDVPGVRVRHSTIISGEGPLTPGYGPIRTGVTAILSHGGNLYTERAAAAVEVLNGSGEVTGRTFIDEMGVMDAPIMLTNSFNVPRVADAVISQTIARYPSLGIDALCPSGGCRVLGPSSCTKSTSGRGSRSSPQDLRSSRRVRSSRTRIERRRQTADPDD